MNDESNEFGQARLLVIGLDSATFKVMQPMLDKGKLPNIQKLIDGGSSGILRSTVPPLSPAAWVTTMTGMNPGGHGVFDFRVLDLNEIHGRSERFVRSSQYAGLTLFDFLGKRGLKVGAFNIPLTYPAGCLIITTVFVSNLEDNQPAEKTAIGSLSSGLRLSIRYHRKA